MQKFCFLLSVFFIMFASFSRCGGNEKSCKDCKTIPQNFHITTSNATQMDFAWTMPVSVNIPYLLTLQDMMTNQKLEVSISATTAQNYSLIKAQHAAFFQPNHLYSAWIQTDCRKLKGCEQNGLGEISTKVYFWNKVKGGELQTPVVTKGYDCSGLLKWGAVPNADKYLVHIFDNQAVLIKTDSTVSTEYNLAGLDSTQLHTVQIQAKRMGNPHQYSPATPNIIICCIVIVEEQVEIVTHLSNNEGRPAIPSLSSCNSSCDGQQKFEPSTADNTIANTFQMLDCVDTDFWRLYFRPINGTRCTRDQNKVYVFGEMQGNQVVKANIRVPAGGDELQYSVTAPREICSSIDYQQVVLSFTGAQGCP